MSHTGKDYRLKGRGWEAVIRLDQGGQMRRLFLGKEQVLAGNGFWMHSSPEGAADATGLGYEMRFSDLMTVCDAGPGRLVVEGRLCRSDGSGQFYGHRYRRHYIAHSWGLEVLHDLWVSIEDMHQAQARWNLHPCNFYVWACPLDVKGHLDHWRWNACRGCLVQGWQMSGGAALPVWGRIPPPDQDGWNNGWTTIPEWCAQPPSMTIYQPGGAGIRRELVDPGNVVQVNVWHNPPRDSLHTLEASVIGGDRQHLTPGWPFLTALKGGESFRFKEKLTFGRCDAAGNMTLF